MLEQFVIYDHPSDFPSSFVCRRWVILGDGTGLSVEVVPDPAPLAVAPTLVEARAAVPGYCYNLGRYAADDPAILEVWL